MRSNVCIKNEIGEIKVNEKEIMERWKEYLSELLNEQSEYRLDDVAKVEGPLKEITEEEEKAAFKGMMNGKAAGPTGVTIDLLQAATMVGLQELTNIMNDNIYGEIILEG